MSILHNALQKARHVLENKTDAVSGVLAQQPDEVALKDHFSTDPLSGYDSTEIAVRLFEAGRLEDFQSHLTSHAISPNIVLANGLTLLQSSLSKFPTDTTRLEALLKTNANPNFYMHRIEADHFGNKSHRASYHPMNYAFAHCPEQTTADICRLLRTYGASADGLRQHFEVDPILAAPDTQEKAQLRKALIDQMPDPKLIEAHRKDIDLSLMQKHLANIETQLTTAGFELTTRTPQKTTEPEIITEPAIIQNPNYVYTEKDLGQNINNLGLYLGRWIPASQDYVALSKSYKVFASPEPLLDTGLPRLTSFSYAVNKVADLKNYFGFNGENYDTYEKLYDDLKHDNYTGGWFIPPRELLDGNNFEGNYINRDNLSRYLSLCQFKKEPNGTYWSLTSPEHNQALNFIIPIKNQGCLIANKEMFFCVLPFRLEPV